MLRRLLALISACAALHAAAADLSPAAVRELAPSGTVRLAIGYGNLVLVNMSGGKLRGVGVDIARELERQTGLRVQLVGYDSVPLLLVGLRSGTWDVALLTSEVARGADMAFTPPYMDVELTYLVPARSRFQSVGDIDSPGVRVVVQEKNTTDIFLSSRLMHAILFRTPDAAGALRMLKAGAAEAYASNREQLLSAAEADSGYRVLAGRFSTISHTVGVPSTHLAAIAYLRAFMENLKASGFVQRAIDNAGIRGVVVSPAAPTRN